MRRCCSSLTRISIRHRGPLTGNTSPTRATQGRLEAVIWILPVSGERKPFPFSQTQFQEGRAQFSPDGHFIAYDSDESGSRQVYVTYFPGPGGKRQVSAGGGSEPIWRKDGKELFFLAEGKLMAAEVKASGSSLDIGDPKLLFDAHTGL